MNSIQGRSFARAQRWTVVGVAWLMGVATVVAVRYRGHWDAFVSMHQWLAEHGVPENLRRFDSLFLYAAAALAGSWMVSRWLGSPWLGQLGLQRALPGWVAMVAVALLPMVAGGLLLGVVRGGMLADMRTMGAKALGGVIRAPVAEELLFRGLLIGVCATVVGWRGRLFWCNAVPAALLFASVHIEWKAGGIARGWPNLLVTGAGGLWYAWLLSRWQSLWIPMALHAGMNLGWMLSGAGGGAGGGGWMENVLRVLTIAVATGWTAKRTPKAMPTLTPFDVSSQPKSQ